MDLRLSPEQASPDERDAVTVFQARPPVYFCPNQLPQARQPLRSSAVGQALLAFSPVVDGLDRRPAALTDLDRVRRSGFAVEIIEREDPVRSVAVPILGPDRQVWGALGVQARSARLNEELVRGIVPAMRQIAGRIGPLFQSTAAITDAPVELYSR